MISLKILKVSDAKGFGKYDCIEFLDDGITFGDPIWEEENSPNLNKKIPIYKDGVLVGTLYEYYANNGTGYHCADDFVPAEGVEVEYFYAPPQDPSKGYLEGSLQYYHTGCCQIEEDHPPHELRDGYFTQRAGWVPYICSGKNWSIEVVEGDAETLDKVYWEGDNK